MSELAFRADITVLSDASRACSGEFLRCEPVERAVATFKAGRILFIDYRRPHTSHHSALQSGFTSSRSASSNPLGRGTVPGSLAGSRMWSIAINYPST
jgi:hypothetical protein